MSFVDLSIVVPAYNEERRLAPTLRTIRAHLGSDPGRWGTWELIVVDDGSTDRTAEVAREAAAAEPRIKVLTSGRNRGKGHALRQGVAATRGRRVLVTDADLATPIEELDRLDKELSEGTAAALASRAHPDSAIEHRQHRLREWLGRRGNTLIRALAVPGIRDTQCGFKLFEGDPAREAFAASRLDGWGIDVEILHHFRASGLRIAEVPVRWSHQPGSKVRPLDYGRVLVDLARLRARSLRPADLAVPVLFLLCSFLLYGHLWTDLGGGYLRDSLQDQNQWEWFFAVTADNAAHLRNPLFTTLQGFPDGVNLMANTTMLGLSVPLTPVTLAFGPTATFALVLTLGTAATAGAWYWLLAKRLVASRWAAATGALLCAYAPPMISHANAHPNFVVLFMIPLIIDRALRIAEGGDIGRHGVVLGLFAAYQIFLGEEPLLLAALGMLLFALFHALVRRDVARAAALPLAKGLGIAALTTFPIIAYPLTWQFFGPQSYQHVEHGQVGNSPLALLAFSARALAGDDETAGALSINVTEQNAFYGWPLVLLAFAITVRMWESPAVRALSLTAVTAAFLSLGEEFRIPLTDMVLPGPWQLLAHRPLFESVIESRIAMICAPALGALLALAVDRLLIAERRPDRLLGLAGVAVALLPIVPTPLVVEDRPEVPAFITSGAWRGHVGEGETLVPVPLPDPGSAHALHWQTTADLGFQVPRGYYMAPWGTERQGGYGAPPRPTSTLLRDVRYSGSVPEIGELQRAQAREDLEYWRAGVLVLAPQDNEEQLRTAVERLLGEPGERVGGAWVWDVGAHR
ncbi:glycosyltransferase [Streptomyces sp. GC420]|nr:glycosyltransferase [Streptomyces sp. GC420]